MPAAPAQAQNALATHLAGCEPPCRPLQYAASSGAPRRPSRKMRARARTPVRALAGPGEAARCATAAGLGGPRDLAPAHETKGCWDALRRRRAGGRGGELRPAGAAGAPDVL